MPQSQFLPALGRRVYKLAGQSDYLGNLVSRYLGTVLGFIATIIQSKHKLNVCFKIFLLHCQIQ